MSAEPVSKEWMTRKMQRQESFGIVVGGFDEASRFARHRERVFIKQRKGFIKYALQFGYKVRITPEGHASYINALSNASGPATKAY